MILQAVCLTAAVNDSHVSLQLPRERVLDLDTELRVHIAQEDQDVAEKLQY